MSYSSTPWTLDEGKVASKVTKRTTKKTEKKSAKTVRLFTADVAIATARVLQLFEKNKKKVFTNKEIAGELGLSEGTVVGITTRLEGLKKIKIVEVLQRVSAYTVLYQHISGPAPRVNKRRGIDGTKKDTAQLMKDLFDENKNKSYTKKDLIRIFRFRGESESQIETSLKILLLDGSIKILDDMYNNLPQYQNSRGNQKGHRVLPEMDSNYITLGKFVEDYNFHGDRKLLTKNLSKDFKLFYSSHGVVVTYPKEDLIKNMKKVQTEINNEEGHN